MDKKLTAEDIISLMSSLPKLIEEAGGVTVAPGMSVVPNIRQMFDKIGAALAKG